ncbi:MAG: carboxymuconolactone decarboxylase family protein [Sinimarinibacterium sp.]|jgi:uncharacterized peroxidase-related enzyme
MNTESARVCPRRLVAYPWYLRPFFWNQKRKYGQVLGPALLWARVPALLIAVASMYAVLDRRRSPLSPVLRSLVTVRVSQINHCRFCVDLNAAVLARRAGSMAKLEALAHWRTSEGFTGAERMALEYAEAVTDSARRVDAALFASLHSHFDDDAIIELTGLIAFQNLSSKFNSALDVPGQGFCAMPGSPPEPHTARPARR